MISVSTKKKNLYNREKIFVDKSTVTAKHKELASSSFRLFLSFDHCHSWSDDTSLNSSAETERE